MKSEESKSIRYRKFRSGIWETIDAGIVIEKPVSLTVNNEIWLTFMCSPSYLEALAVGFLFNEGIINSTDDIASVRACAHEDNVDVWLNFNVEQPKDWRRTSGCTGGFTSVIDHQTPAHIDNGHVISPKVINRLVVDLLNTQKVYREVGGIHSSVLSDGLGQFIIAEDIGRHNTVDKIAGRYLLEERVFLKRIFISTGRISSDMLQKAARLGASIVVSRTSPSSLSIELAEHWGITLVGYARRDGYNIYTHAGRIGQMDERINLISEATIKEFYTNE